MSPILIAQADDDSDSPGTSRGVNLFVDLLVARRVKVPGHDAFVLDVWRRMRGGQLTHLRSLLTG